MLYAHSIFIFQLSDKKVRKEIESKRNLYVTNRGIWKYGCISFIYVTFTTRHTYSDIKNTLLTCNEANTSICMHKHSRNCLPNFVISYFKSFISTPVAVKFLFGTIWHNTVALEMLLYVQFIFRYLIISKLFFPAYKHFINIYFVVIETVLKCNLKFQGLPIIKSLLPNTV